MYKSIKVKQETYELLKKLKVSMIQNEPEKPVSFDDVILYALSEVLK